MYSDALCPFATSTNSKECSKYGHPVYRRYNSYNYSTVHYKGIRWRHGIWPLDSVIFVDRRNECRYVAGSQFSSDSCARIFSKFGTGLGGGWNAQSVLAVGSTDWLKLVNVAIAVTFNLSFWVSCSWMVLVPLPTLRSITVIVMAWGTHAKRKSRWRVKMSGWFCAASVVVKWVWAATWTTAATWPPCRARKRLKLVSVIIAERSRVYLVLWPSHDATMKCRYVIQPVAD